MLGLDSAGRQLLAARQAGSSGEPHIRATALPGERTVRHTLAVAGLYTDLAGQTSGASARLTTFETEPACWWPDGLGRYLKPDAFLVLENLRNRDYWWIEMDLNTETLATIKRKALSYLDFVQRGQIGPRDIIPRVLISVPDKQRMERIQKVLSGLLPPAAELLFVSMHEQTAAFLLEVLRE